VFSIEYVLYVTLWNVFSKKNAAHRRGPGTHSQSLYTYKSANSENSKSQYPLAVVLPRICIHYCPSRIEDVKYQGADFSVFPLFCFLFFYFLFLFFRSRVCGVIFLVDLAHFRTQMTGVVEIPVRYRSDADESSDTVNAVCYGLI
jgi:hypothetical protein